MTPCVCGCPTTHQPSCAHGCVLPEPDDGTPTPPASVHPRLNTDPYNGIYARRYFL